MTSVVYSRLSRPGTSRSSEPDGRLKVNPDLEQADLVWDLWNLRAVFPAADREDLLRILRRRERGLAREREALAGLWAGEQGNLSPGRDFLSAHPDLCHGITVSLHQGPYQLLAEPWLAAGLDPVLLINAEAEAEFAAVSARTSQHLGHRGKLTFVAVGPHGSVKRAVQAIRDGRPVLAYLDGNNGERGMAGTRSRGLRYRLPGREIKVRTGLARLACRLGAPVHPVSLGWEQNSLVWEGESSWHPQRDDDVNRLTHLMFDWLFSQVMRRPEQWHHWSMLKDSSACFAGIGLDAPLVPRGLRKDFQRAFESCLERSAATVKLILEKEVEIWPGDVLADLTEDRFYPAAGLGDADLEPLRRGTPTLAELKSRHGEIWVRFHGLRLCLLGMARLGG